MKYKLLNIRDFFYLGIKLSHQVMDHQHHIKLYQFLIFELRSKIFHHSAFCILHSALFYPNLSMVSLNDVSCLFTALLWVAQAEERELFA